MKIFYFIGSAVLTCVLAVMVAKQSKTLSDLRSEVELFKQYVNQEAEYILDLREEIEQMKATDDSNRIP